MATITITIEGVSPELVDEDHPTGLTSEGFDTIFDAVTAFGDSIDIQAAD